MIRHRITRLLISFGTFCIGAFALSASALAGKPLFVGQAGPDTNVAAAAINAIEGSPDTLSVRVMRADAAVVDGATTEIELDLGAHRVNALLDKAYTTPTGSLIWSGQLREAQPRPLTRRETGRDEMNSATLVRRGSGITGDVFVAGKLFRIQPLPDGNHAVIEVDQSRFPPDHAPGAADVQASTRDAVIVAPDFNVVPDAVTANTVIRATAFATSDAVADYSGDMQALVELAVSETNQGYANSGVNITMQLTGYQSVTYTEGGNFDTMTADFAGKTDGKMDGVHAIRDQQAGDVAVLIIKSSAYCGQADAIGATADTAYAIVSRGCATGYYSFGHEVGHLQGARHDTAVDSSTTPYAYGHGYIAPDKSWRTIMAYPSGCNSCTRLDYWSNPGVAYGGVAMGTTATNDNHRVLNSTAATVAAFRPDPGSNAPPIANFTYTTSGLTANFTDTSTDSNGTIASRSWNFGDSTTSTATNPSHAYTAAGTYSVTLTVTDNGGATNAVSKSVTVTAINAAPTANFTYGVSGVTASFFDSSSDSDGTIASRAWNFGDSSTSTATNPSHTYANGGSYNVTLTVTDNGGKTGTVTKSVVINAPPPNVLQKGVTVTGLSASAGGSVNYTMSVPAGATNLSFTISGGTGDADLYVKFGSAPTDGVYDCRPYKTGNAETCTFPTPSTGTWYVRVKAYGSSPISGVSLVGDYIAGGGGTQTYTNSTATPIADLSTINSTISVSGRTGNAPSTAQVSVNITHTFRGDLKIDLLAADGSVYNLKASSSTDSAANVVATYTANLSTEPLNGTWTLRVQDVASGDSGTLNNWSITF